MNTAHLSEVREEDLLRIWFILAFCSIMRSATDWRVEEVEASPAAEVAGASGVADVAGGGATFAGDSGREPDEWRRRPSNTTI